jgi:hypothetical protein
LKRKKISVVQPIPGLSTNSVRVREEADSVVHHRPITMATMDIKNANAGNSPADVVVPDKPLLMGDIVYFNVNRNDFDGYICSEGFVDNRITVQWFGEGSGNLPEDMQQCLFKVVPKRSYKAQNEVRDMEKKVTCPPTPPHPPHPC